MISIIGDNFGPDIQSQISLQYGSSATLTALNSFQDLTCTWRSQQEASCESTAGVGRGFFYEINVAGQSSGSFPAGGFYAPLQ